MDQDVDCLLEEEGVHASSRTFPAAHADPRIPASFPIIAQDSALLADLSTAQPRARVFPRYVPEFLFVALDCSITSLSETTGMIEGDADCAPRERGSYLPPFTGFLAYSSSREVNLGGVLCTASGYLRPLLIVPVAAIQPLFCAVSWRVS